MGTAASTLFTDTGLAPASTHTYTVAAVDAGGNVTHSAPVSSTTAQAAPAPPAVPTGVTATAISSSQITVSWNPSPGATSYVVRRDGQLPGRVFTTTNLTDGGFPENTTHTYRIAAVNAAGQSAMSAPAAARTPFRLSVVPTSIDFGNVRVVGGTATRTITAITNTTVGSLPRSGANPGNFTLSNDLCTGRSLAPGATCTVNVVFNPSAIGTRTATLTVLRTGATVGDTVSLRGQGTLL